MNRSLLDQLQQMRSYPSITVLMNTTRGSTLSADEIATARRLIQTAADRLTGDVDDRARTLLTDRLHASIEERTGQRSGQALALCVSRDHDAVVSLGGPVEERVVIDETFATRDLVADLNRTASYRIATMSESAVRIFLGDRGRIVEERSDDWPLHRGDEVSDAIWSRQVNDALRQAEAGYSLPLVVVGVQRTVARLLDDSGLEIIGHVTGNHDRTGPAELHTLIWPMVLDWIGAQESRALDRLDDARSSKRYASGVHEIWPLANEGRVDLVVVEEDFSMSARIDDNGQLDPSDDDHRDVTDDVVDEIIEAVLQNGGHATMVSTSTLESHGRIAAVLRY